MLLGFFVCSAFTHAAESYFITVQKLELKRADGDWVKIIEPDHRVDLTTTEAVISFFNNGRIPSADFNNFRVSFEDHGVNRQMTRHEDFQPAVHIKKGSFVYVSFDLDLGNGRVKQLKLNVDEVSRTDSTEQIEMKGDPWS